MEKERKKSVKKLIISLVLGIMVFFALPMPTVDAAQTGLNKTSISVYKGKTYRLSMQNVKKGIKVIWKTSDSKIVSVKASGTECIITGKGAGTAVVSATIGTRKYQCKVTVKNLPVSLSVKTKTLNKGASFIIALQNTTSNANWSVSDKKILKLKKLATNKYQITGLKAGSARVYAKVGNKKYTCTVTVKNATINIPSCAAQQTVYVDDGHIFVLPSLFIYIKNLDPKAKVTDIKSSDPRLGAEKRGDIDAIEIRSASEAWGTDLTNTESTITFKVIQNGKTYKLSCHITVKTSESPFASFKVGTQDIAKEFEGHMRARIWVEQLNTEEKQKILIKMAPGYVLDYILVISNSNGEIDSYYIENGDSIKIDKNIDISISYHTTKKPANYKESKEWFGIVKSPLHELKYLYLYMPGN